MIATHLASYVRPMALGFDASTWSVLMAAVDGELSFTWVHSTAPRPERMGWATSADLPRLVSRATFVQRASLYKGKEVAALGFGYIRASYDASLGGITRERSLWMPLWPPWAIGTIVVVATYRRWSRLHHRRATGLCLICGYDLRGSASRCPECGNAA
jgi:hypothetical protein